MPTTSPTSPLQNTQSLDQGDFLKLLVTQMTSQDPLNPQSDTAFAATRAFTALQTAQTTQANVATLQASQMIGSTVTVMPNDDTPKVTGVVTAVQMNSGKPSLIVGGKSYDLTQVLYIAPTAPTP